MMGNIEEVFAAIQSGDMSRLKQLIGENPSLARGRNPAGVSALMMAMYVRNSGAAELLREAAGDVDIFEATSLGEIDRLKTLLADPHAASARSADGFTALHYAAFFGQPDAALHLLQAGADVNAVAENASRVQPIHSAAASGNVEIVRLLLQHGADANAAQHGGWTALQSAAKHGNQPLIELLLAHGADPRQQTDDGQTAVTMAKDDAIRQQLESA
jgi:ankyrin repeat protein